MADDCIDDLLDMILDPTLEMALETCPEREASSRFSAWNCLASSSLLGSKWCLKRKIECESGIFFNRCFG